MRTARNVRVYPTSTLGPENNHRPSGRNESSNTIPPAQPIVVTTMATVLSPKANGWSRAQKAGRFFGVLGYRPRRPHAEAKGT